MFSRPTVFIIGAGASAEFGMPLGSQLLEKVATTVARGTHGHPNHDVFVQQMRDGLGEERANRLFELGPRLAGVVSQFVSMDEALHFLSAEPDIVELGKLAIAHEIVHAERNSTLYRAIEANDPGVGDTKQLLG
jgi:hypothetical protein